jgi:type IV secretion system protein TrbL
MVSGRAGVWLAARASSVCGALARGVLIILSLVLIAGACAPSAHARGSVETAGRIDAANGVLRLPVISGDRGDFQRALQAPVSGYLEAAATIHQRLLPWGVNLAALLTGVSLVWLGIRTMLDRGALGALMIDLITLLLTAGILFAVLDNWGTFTRAIVDGTHDVARQVSGNVHDGPAAIMGVQRIVDAGFALWEHSDASLGAWLDPLAMLATLLFKLLIVGLLLACGFIYLGMYLLSMSLLAIAFALGPIFIPWLLLRPASFLFDGWLRFTLIAALYQVVGIVIVTLISRMHEPMLASLDAAVAGPSATFNFYYFAAAFLLSGVSALLMLQIPAIANGLLSGVVPVRAAAAAALASAPARAAGAGAGGAARLIGRGAAAAASALDQGRTQRAAGAAAAPLPRIDSGLLREGR